MSEELHFLVIENVQDTRKKLIADLRAHFGARIGSIAEATTVSEALNNYQGKHQIVLLDHSLVGHKFGTTGLDFLKRLQETKKDIPRFLLATASIDVILQYNQFMPYLIGYYHKPFSDDMMVEIDRQIYQASVRLQPAPETIFTIQRVRAGVTRHSFSDLVKVTVEDDMMTMFFNDGTTLNIFEPLNSFMNRYTHSPMVRVSKNCSVNTQYFHGLSEKQLTLKQLQPQQPQEIIRVGEAYLARVRLFFRNR